MTQKQRIELLERKIIELEARLAAQEARPYYVYWQQPNPTFQYPYWTTTWNGELTNAGAI